MIAFQVVMLEDDELVRPALAAIADGTPADIAWEVAMDRRSPATRLRRTPIFAPARPICRTFVTVY